MLVSEGSNRGQKTLMADWRQHAARVGRAGKIVARYAVRVMAWAAATLSSLAIFLFVMLTGYGLSVDGVKPTLERAIERRTGVDDVRLGGIDLIRVRGSDHPFHVRMKNINIHQGDGGGLTISELSLQLGPDLVLGDAMPRFIDMTGASILIERGGDSVSLGSASDPQAPFDVAAILRGARDAGFEGAILRDIDLRYRNRDTGADLSVDGGTVSINPNADGFLFELLVTGDEPSSSQFELALMANADTGDVRVDMTAQDTPASVFLPLLLGARDDIQIDTDVSGTVEARGSLEAGFDHVLVNMQAAPGEVLLHGIPLDLDRLEVDAALSPNVRSAQINSLNFSIAGVSGFLEGKGDAVFSAQGIETGTFEILGRDFVIAGDGVLPEPLAIADVQLQGRFDAENDSLVFDAIDADYYGRRLIGTTAIAFAPVEGQSLGMTIALGVDGELSPADVLRAWPVEAAGGARRWISRSLLDATLSNVQFDLDMPVGALSDDEVRVLDFVDLTFDARDAVVTYVPGMRPIRNLSASARIDGNSFLLEADRGRVGAVSLTSGSVEIGRLVPKGYPAEFRVSVEGPLQDILSIVDEDPLGYVSKAGFDVEAFEGEGTFDLLVRRPMYSRVPLSDYEFYGEGVFENMTVDTAAVGLPVTNGQGRVRLTSNDLTIDGAVEVEGVPADVRWSRQFGGLGRSVIEASASLDSGSADAIGLPLRRFLRGVVNAEIRAEGNRHGYDRVEFRADLLDAAITLNDQDFLKDFGEAGEAEMVLQLGEEGAGSIIETLRVTMPGANVEGNALLAPGGALEMLDVPRLFVDGYADLSLFMRRDDRGVRVRLDGDYINARPLIDMALNRTGETQALPGALHIDALIARVDTKGDVSLRDVTVVADHDGEHMQNVQGQGEFVQGGNVSFSLEEHSMSIGQNISLTTENFGLLMAGLFDVTSVSGDAATLTATAIDDGPLVGQLGAQNIDVQNAPTVARLLSVGSLDGFANLVNGEGLSFDALEADFQLSDGVLDLVDARLTGDALGLSGNGSIRLADRELNVFGAVAPAYQVNSWFGDVPGLGALLVNRKGEGLVAFAYRLEGPIAQPTISVNTLAVLAPGIFRRVFEPLTEERPSTRDLLIAAEEAAGLTAPMPERESDTELTEGAAENGDNP